MGTIATVLRCRGLLEVCEGLDCPQWLASQSDINYILCLYNSLWIWEQSAHAGCGFSLLCFILWYRVMEN